MSISKMLDEKIKEAMKSRDEVARNVLGVVKGQIQLESSTADINEDRKQSIIRKLIKSNDLVADAIKEELAGVDTGAESDRAKDLTGRLRNLHRENEILSTFLTGLPSTGLTDEQTLMLIQTSGINVKAAKSDGEAMGQVMKLIKASGFTADNGKVKALIVKLRSE